MQKTWFFLFVKAFESWKESLKTLQIINAKNAEKMKPKHNVSLLMSKKTWSSTSAPETRCSAIEINETHLIMGVNKWHTEVTFVARRLSVIIQYLYKWMHRWQRDFRDNSNSNWYVGYISKYSNGDLIKTDDSSIWKTLLSVGYSVVHCH